VEKYCPLPFKHIFLEPRGKRPCCSYKNVYDKTVEQWIASDELKNLQSNILQGNIDPGCETCFEKEKTDGVSTRLSALRDYEYQKFTQTQIDYIDFRSSNICNFKCRSCEPFFSNGIAQEAKKYPKLNRFFASPERLPQGKVAPTETSDHQWVIDNLSSIKKLMFTGGEPTRIPEVKKIIDHIIDKNIKDVQVLITTNASFTDEYWFDITRTLPNIHWTLSLDAVGNSAEIVRHGTKWPLVSGNIEKMFDISPSVNIGTIITNLNVMSLPDLFDYSNTLYEKYQHRANGRTQLIEVCRFPDYMSPYNLPDGVRDRAVNRLSAYLASGKHLQEAQKNILESLITNLRTRDFIPRLWKLFQEHNEALDEVRGENYHDLFR